MGRRKEGRAKRRDREAQGCGPKLHSVPFFQETKTLASGIDETPVGTTTLIDL